MNKRAGNQIRAPCQPVFGPASAVRGTRHSGYPHSGAGPGEAHDDHTPTVKSRGSNQSPAQKG